MYKYNYDSSDNISLHDCRATHIELNGDVLSFIFDEGIYAREYSEQYLDGRWFSTKKAEMRVRLQNEDPESNVEMYLFDDPEVDKEKMSLQRLIYVVNNGAKLEFLDCDYKSARFYGDLHKPHDTKGILDASKQFDMNISSTEVTYHWNEMHPYGE